MPTNQLTPTQYPMCAEMLMYIFGGFEFPILRKRELQEIIDVYMKDNDSVQLLKWCAKKVNYWAKLTGIKREQLTVWRVPDLNDDLPPQINLPDVLVTDTPVDGTRILMLLELNLPPSHQNNASISDSVRWSLVEARIREETNYPLMASQRRERWRVARVARDTRIQKWPHCVALLEVFMRILEADWKHMETSGHIQKWKYMEESTHIQKWRNHVCYSRDPENHLNEKLQNPIDAFEYWAHNPETMKILQSQLNYTPDNPSVPSPPSSIMPDWTFAVHVLRWMVIHDPTVDPTLATEYTKEPISIELIDHIEHTYSTIANNKDQFMLGILQSDGHPPEP